MSLKPQSDKVPMPLPVSPVWGELADAGQTVSVVVFVCADAAYTYPYHTLSRWVWAPGATDTLRVQAGEDEVTIHGRNLHAIGDALGSARLRVLRATNERYETQPDAVVVSRISVETLSSEN